MSKIQAYCYWCTDPIYADKVDDVKCFWNSKKKGRPICDKCLGNFRAGKQLKRIILRNK